MVVRLSTDVTIVRVGLIASLFLIGLWIGAVLPTSTPQTPTQTTMQTMLVPVNINGSPSLAVFRGKQFEGILPLPFRAK